MRVLSKDHLRHSYLFLTSVSQYFDASVESNFFPFFLPSSVSFACKSSYVLGNNSQWFVPGQAVTTLSPRHKFSDSI